MIFFSLWFLTSILNLLNISNTSHLRLITYIQIFWLYSSTNEINYLFPPMVWSSNRPHTSECTSSSMQEDLIDIVEMKDFLDYFPTKQPSQSLSGIWRLGIPITIYWVISWLCDLKFKWPNVKCHNQLFLWSTSVLWHCTSTELIMVLNFMFFDKGYFKIKLFYLSNNSKAPSFITTKKPVLTSCPSFRRLHLIPGTYGTSLIIDFFLHCSFE